MSSASARSRPSWAATKRWDRLENAYDALVYGEGVQDSDPIHAIEESYKNGVTDEFVEPIVCDKDGMISDNDSVIFFNYRPDRAREITRAFVDPAFDGFKREFFPLTYVCNTEYDATMPNVLVAFPRISVKNGLGEYLSKMGMTQLRIAETEKDDNKILRVNMANIRRKLEKDPAQPKYIFTEVGVGYRMQEDSSEND